MCVIRRYVCYFHENAINVENEFCRQQLNMHQSLNKFEKVKTKIELSQK
jgi:hypothetical protein